MNSFSSRIEIRIHQLEGLDKLYLSMGIQLKKDSESKIEVIRLLREVVVDNRKSIKKLEEIQKNFNS